jgi:hypothetical protein
MRIIASIVFYLAAVTAAYAGPDSIAACRVAYADNPAAHIACLESALLEPCGVDAPTAKAKDQPTGLGSEKLLQTERIIAGAPAEQETFLIVSATYNAQGLGVFRLENGQVWRETVKSSGNKRLKPDQQYQALIERAKIGGYRMYVDGVRWMYKVERLK